MAKLILASASARRRALLAQIGIVPAAIRPADIDETPRPSESPRICCARLAREKALAIAAGSNEAVLAADTIVAVGRRILGKPADEDEVRTFLRLMSGRRHRVITSVAIRRNEKVWQKDAEATVRMVRLTDADMDAYVAMGEWRDKAGGYGVQGHAARFIPCIRGSYTAVVGLPLTETASLLQTAGVLKRCA